MGLKGSSTFVISILRFKSPEESEKLKQIVKIARNKFKDRISNKKRNKIL
ncbi:MAG: hypothetical protein LBM96_09145 [Methanobrevibacter sp.]|nr:hypothetical protein [Candidatus Methanoflexus mossambicus]